MTAVHTEDTKVESELPDIYAVMEKLASDQRYQGENFRTVRETLLNMTKAYGMAVNDVSSAGGTLMVHKPDPLLAKDSYTQLSFALLVSMASSSASRIEHRVNDLICATADVFMLLDTNNGLLAAIRLDKLRKQAQRARASAFADLMSLSFFMLGLSTQFADTTDVRQVFYEHGTRIRDIATQLFPAEALVSSDAERATFDRLFKEAFNGPRTKEKE